MEQRKLWDDTIPGRAYKLCLLGLTNEELAVAFGVSLKRVDAWEKNRSKFKRALRLGRQEADAEIAKAMYQRAKGYSHPDVHVAIYKGEVIVTDIVKYYPPDTAAAQFWLKNRQKDKWADISRVDITNTVNINDSKNKLNDFSDEELDLLEKMGLQGAYLGQTGGAVDEE
jgi:transcriptional regulator with XRE-family HTH domain